MTVYLVTESYADQYGENNECVCVCATEEKAKEWIKFNHSKGCDYRIEPMDVLK